MTRDQTMDIEVSASDHRVFELAAKRRGQTLSTFVREAALRMAKSNCADAAEKASKPKVKPLVWRTVPALGGHMKIIATDMFGNEFARLDWRGQTDDVIASWKEQREFAYSQAVLDALDWGEPT